MVRAAGVAPVKGAQARRCQIDFDLIDLPGLLSRCLKVANVTAKALYAQKAGYADGQNESAQHCERAQQL